MTKRIETLVEDIERVLVEGVDIDETTINNFGNILASVIARRISRKAREQNSRRTLRMSNIGTPCNRKLWFSVNGEGGEPLRPEAYLKFLYGDLIEELILFLAEVSGHKVEGRQDTLEVEGIEGHRDAVIDGTLVDSKSASSYSFKKFKEHTLANDDPFGYIDQLQSYLEASQDDPIVTDKTRAAFLVVDKTLGHICLDFHEKTNFPIRDMFNHKKEMVASPEMPGRGYEAVPEGKSGNLKLGVQCSYCEWSKKCWPEMRTFLYSTGPVSLVHVEKLPKVPEITEGIMIDKEKDETETS